MVAGHLVSVAFLEQHLQSRPDAHHFAERRPLAPWRARCASLGPAAGLRAMVEIGIDPLVRLLGFSGLQDIRYGDRTAGATLGGERLVAAIITPWAEPLDGLWRTAVVEAQRRGAEWCLLFNGLHLRLVDARRVYSRRYTELDLDAAADETAIAAALWVLCGATAFDCDGHRAPIGRIVAASERHGADVCRSLRHGVLEASQEVMQAMIARRPRDPSWTFEQALTVVYRILFLLFAEARALVPIWHPIYRQAYSVEALRETAERTPMSPGLWDTLRAMSRIAHAGCHAGDLRVTAFNGRLFSAVRTPLAERRDLDNLAIGRAVLSLATRPAPDRAGRERIAYGDLGVEQLGAVYEALLDYEPRVEQAGRVSLQRGSVLRKATGSFYTPQPLAHYLVRRALAPLVDQASPERILDLKVVDPAMGSGAFLVAACDYLAQAYETALVRSGGCHPSDLGPPERASIRRSIAERCLFGVDLNPMAVQLARLSLWLLTLAADRPLTFLDHHLVAGDSLLGAWLANLRHAPMRRRSRPSDTLPLFDTPALGDALRQALPGRFTLATAAADSVEHVREKERLLAALTSRDAALSKWKRVADLWCASWFDGRDAPRSAFGALSDRILTGTSTLSGAVAEPLLRRAEEVAAGRRFFHWELEFPEAFFDLRGNRLAAPGFDAVIGNPPWDMIRADSGAVPERSRARLDANAVVRFTRDAGVYAAQSDGHANRYQLFLERALRLTRRGGRLGLVLPSGVMSDHGSARLRHLLLSQCGVDAIVGFDNRAGVFSIHRSIRFVLLTATSGQPTNEIACRLGERDPAALETGGSETDDSWYPVRITPAVLERLTGPDLALPELTSRIDLTIAERAASLCRPLGEPSGWAARFGRELNATDDRGYFYQADLKVRTREADLKVRTTEAGGPGLPIIEGKQLEPFGVDVARSRWRIAPKHADRLLGTRHRHWRLGYRDVASATNRTTLIAAMLPPGTATTHTVFCLRTSLPREAQNFLCALFNSFVVNYLARLRVTTHVTTAIVERLPIPRFDEVPDAPEIARIAAALGNVRLKAETTPNVVSGFSRTSALAKLNAVVADLYQLTEAEFRHVLGTFPLVPLEEREAALREFQSRRV
jgi:hypothetical protein